MKTIYKLLTCLAVASGVMGVQATAFAQTAKAKPAARAKAKAAKPAETTEAQDEDDIVPDIGQSKTFEYKCELGDFVTIYTNVDDDKHVAMRWKKRLYRLKRIDTTTGANRFENKKAGFVWIGIPAKGMLLDSIHGHQLANECRTTDVAAQAESTATTAAQAPAK
ncbi:hypothetical protein [Undibacterium sp.]|uniref:hypothetical protein n=1 Tax=Undibacterium sp. TaxID=1914977 RepID=UPI002CC6E782|nr:hypothetical protein [Undibacterium sp.]HTD04770.1 hypothetical protein [Undibacterium sp.]